MPGPRFVSCSICRRQIMPHSLAIHEAKCMEKWCMENNGMPPNHTTSSFGTPPTAAGHNRNKQNVKASPTKKRQSITPVIRPGTVVHPQFRLVGTKTATLTRGVLHAKPESTNVEVQKVDTQSQTIGIRPFRAGSIDENTMKRPGTVTLSPGGRAASLDRVSGTANEDSVSDSSLCYVCGQRCNRNVLNAHEKKCLHMWQCLVAKLPPAIKVYKPNKLQHPSVDGTVDPARLDIVAQQSSQRSQKVDCSRCRTTGIALLAAREHVRQCGTQKPEKIATKDASNGGTGGGKPKRKKPKDREFFVSIFA